jgi:hypothetical protein
LKEKEILKAEYEEQTAEFKNTLTRKATLKTGNLRKELEVAVKAKERAEEQFQSENQQHEEDHKQEQEKIRSEKQSMIVEHQKEREATQLTIDTLSQQYTALQKHAVESVDSLEDPKMKELLTKLSQLEQTAQVDRGRQEEDRAKLETVRKEKQKIEEDNQQEKTVMGKQHAAEKEAMEQQHRKEMNTVKVKTFTLSQKLTKLQEQQGGAPQVDCEKVKALEETLKVEKKLAVENLQV